MVLLFHLLLVGGPLPYDDGDGDGEKDEEADSEA